MNTFKKKIIASAVALGFVGAAQAATSVTLYGIVDVGYQYNSTTTSTPAYESGVSLVGGTSLVAGDHGQVTHGTTGGNFDITVPAYAGGTFTGVLPSSTTTSGRIIQRDGYHDDSRLGVKKVKKIWVMAYLPFLKQKCVFLRTQVLCLLLNLQKRMWV